MKKTASLFFVVSLMLASFTANAQNLRGDVNNDDKVSIEDVTDLIDYLLTGDASDISLVNADCDLDGRVSIADLTVHIDYLLTGSWGDDPVTPTDKWVDLGLPSGTIWATRNIGANCPEEYGDYFAWGETEPKDYYDFSNYKWYKSDENYHGFTKYVTYSYYGYKGFTDGKTELDPADDAATANWGEEAQMPMNWQVEELANNCSWQWTMRNGVNGQLGTGPNGNTIFLPAAGWRVRDLLKSEGSLGCYFSHKCRADYSYADCLDFTSQYVQLYSGFYRYDGLTVRAVRVQ